MRKAHDELPEDNAAMWTELEKRADRIEALEFEVEHERYNVEKIAQEAAKRIKALEAALQQSVDDWRERGRRIEALEAALRKIAELEYLTDEAMQKIAENALDQSSPPKAST